MEQKKLLSNDSLTTLLLAVKILFNLLALAVPLAPIVVSAIMSCWIVYKSQWKCDKNDAVSVLESVLDVTKFLSKLSRLYARSSRQSSIRKPPHIVGRQQSIQSKATVTILILTFSYILFNVPVCIVYVLFTIHWAKSWASPLFQDYFSIYYLWGLVYVVLVVCNAMVNPIIYTWRIRKIRLFYWYKISQA